jgi:hypothetical protein
VGESLHEKRKKGVRRARSKVFFIRRIFDVLIAVRRFEPPKKPLQF